MKKGLTKYIVCPECRKDLNFAEYSDDVINGLLCCSNSHYYPVINEVPVLIKNKYLENFLNQYEVEKFRQACINLKIDFKFQKQTNTQIDLLKRNYINWSLEWNKYSFEQTVWENKKTFLEHIPVDLHLLDKFKTILEIGCGNGRDIKHIKNKKNLVFALDISESAYIAHKRYVEDENVFIVRCDAMSLPFKDNYFDLVFSDHVLHHINEINICFKEIRRVAQSNNSFIFNLYSKENNFILTKIVEPFKKLILSKLPVNFIHFVSNIPAFFLWLIIKGIYLPLNRSFKNIYKLLPLCQHMTFWFSFKYEILRQTCFDLLHAPVSYYFSNEDIEKLSAITFLELDKKYLLRQTLWICKGRFKK